MSMSLRPLGALVLLGGLFAPPTTAPPTALTASAVMGVTSRVSVSTGGAQANGSSASPILSANGRFVAFTSSASNLVPKDTNDWPDVFLRDRLTGATSRVSVSNTGAQLDIGSFVTSISSDGRYIVFEEVGDPGAGSEGVFVRDRKAGTTTLVSVSTAGTPALFESREGVISGDGRYVAFSSRASDVVPGDTNDSTDVFVHDRQTGTTKRVSVATGGVQADHESNWPTISEDGRYISFMSTATNLVAGDTNGRLDVFLHDQVTGDTTRISVATGGAQGNDLSMAPAISADGRHIAFDSYATNLVRGDTNHALDVFLHDRITGETVRSSVNALGTQANNTCSSPKVSQDGRYVTFESSSTNLVAGDTNQASDVFVHDQTTGATTRANVSTAGSQANVDSGTSAEPAISDDGRYVAFVSLANNLVAGDTNNPDPQSFTGVDVFVRDQLTAVPPTPFGDFNGGGWSDVIARQTSTGSLWLYPGNSVGFTARTEIGTGWNSMSAIARLGDVDRDGHEDVIAQDKTGVLWLYRGTGHGFMSRVRMGASGWNAMREVTPVGDLSGDGYPDLLAVQTSTGALYLYPGRGTSFGARQLLGLGWNTMSELAGVGDFNRDGHPDLLARKDATGELWLYPGRSGGFAAKSRIGIGWNGMRDLTGIGDFDRDGHTDLFAVQTTTGKLLMYPGRGTSLGASLQVGTAWTGYRPLL
ncbi:VCBS repeat-containing protein [Terracoccus sp. 273MFTsu3.1]|uniref:VCBS repeat-containing protein n=1 Tax=Terracoccus sp. 273MFTsu3.1 TaxID=1172188 RepID=UPI001E30384D|nr:FG-GAP-like repeat-containing protein [Terracoccus sp. 273MFTsu3.1]